MDRKLVRKEKKKKKGKERKGKRRAVCANCGDVWSGRSGELVASVDGRIFGGGVGGVCGGRTERKISSDTVGTLVEGEREVR